MVHTAAAFAKQSRRLRTFACTTSIGPGATNMVTGAANATVNRLPVLLLPGDRFATRRVKPVLQQLERPDAGDVSVNDAFRPVSRYFDRIERPEMLIDALPAGDARADLAGRDRRGHAGPAAGRAGRGLGVAGARCWSRAPGSSRGRARMPAQWQRAADLIAAAERPMIVVGGGVDLQRCGRCPRCLRQPLRHPRHRDAGGQGRPALGPSLQPGRPRLRPAASAGNAVARDADLVIAIGTRLSDFPTMSWSAWQDPDVTLRRHQRGRARRGQGRRHPARGRCPRDAARSCTPLSNARGLDRRRRASAASASSGLRSEWNDEVDRVLHLASETHVSQPEVIRLVNEAARRRRHRGLRRRRAARRPAQAVATGHARQLPPGVRLLHHGLRDRRRHRRGHGRAAIGAST